MSQYNKYVHKPFVEFEFRLGKQSKGGFDTNIGKNNYNNILKTLQSFPNWRCSTVSSYKDTFYQNGLRINSSSNEAVTKSKLYASNKKLSPHTFDIRFAICLETPAVQNNESDEIYVRDKTRHSFRHEFFRIDLTHITNIDSYELEIEIVDMDYARKHSPSFIITCILKEVVNLITISSNM